MNFSVNITHTRAICLAVAALLTLSSCKSKKNVEPDDVVVERSTAARVDEPAQRNCFSLLGKDTVALSFSVNADVVTGDLRYILAGKDRNEGKITGTLHGDTLIGHYTFNAEGSQSSRQVAFLVQGENALEGYGAAVEKDGKMLFKNTADLKFGEGVVLKKNNCE